MRKRRSFPRAMYALAVLAAASSLWTREIITDAKESDSDALEAQLSTFSGTSITELDFGACSCLKFTLPRDEEVKIELWHSNDVRPLGWLYGISCPVDVSNGGSRGWPEYQQTRTVREEDLPEKLEALSTQGAYQRASRVQGMEGANILIWKGQYVPTGEAFPRYVRPGSYEIRITPMDFGQSQERLVLPVEITGSGYGGRLTEEDVQDVMRREEEVFPREHMHVLDTLVEPENCRVDLLSGQLFWKQEVFSAEEGGLPFSYYHRAGRYYPEQGLNIAGLGELWTHSYSYRAEIYRMDIQIYLPEGESISFSREYRKGWQPWGEGELPYRLDELEDGFLLYIPTGGSVYFDSSGRAIQITQADGSKLNLSYADDRLYRVTGEADVLSFRYQGDALIEVSNEQGEHVEFVYGNGWEDVGMAILPGERPVSYAYDDKHQLLQADMHGELELAVEYDAYSTMTGRAKVKTLRMPKENLNRVYTYDEKAKTHRYREKKGGGLEVTYEDDSGTGYEGCTWTLYNRWGDVVRVSDPLGETTVYESSLTR